MNVNNQDNTSAHGLLTIAYLLFILYLCSLLVYRVNVSDLAEQVVYYLRYLDTVIEAEPATVIVIEHEREHELVAVSLTNHC